MGALADTWTPTFSPWRHGGWYVDNLQHLSGAVGCVSRNFPDKKWRIVCDPRPGSYPGGPDDHTYPSRDAAARAEKELADAAITAHRQREAEAGGPVCKKDGCHAALVHVGVVDGLHRWDHPVVDGEAIAHRNSWRRRLGTRTDHGWGQHLTRVTEQGGTTSS